jgi:hypothetical protein
VAYSGADTGAARRLAPAAVWEIGSRRTHKAPGASPVARSNANTSAARRLAPAAVWESGSRPTHKAPGASPVARSNANTRFNGRESAGLGRLGTILESDAGSRR